MAVVTDLKAEVVPNLQSAEISSRADIPVDTVLNTRELASLQKLFSDNNIPNSEALIASGKIKIVVENDSVVELHMRNLKVSNISEISNLTNLRALDLYGNHIESAAALGTLSSLYYANLAANQLKTLEGMENCLSLRSVMLCNNDSLDSSSLNPLSALPNLGEVFLRGNPRITSLDALKELNLFSMDVSGTKIPVTDTTITRFKQAQEEWRKNHYFYEV